MATIPIILEDENGRQFHCQVPEDDHMRILNGDLSLAQQYLEKEVEVQNYKNTRDQSSNCNSETNKVEEQDSFKWTHQLTKSLINARLDKEYAFNRPTCKKKKLWNLIATTIISTANNGCLQLTGSMCDIKYRNLLCTYKKNKKKTEQSGEGAVTWEYFNTFDEVLGHKASTIPSKDIVGDCDSIIAAASNELEKDCGVAKPTQEKAQTLKRKGTMLDFVKYKYENEKQRRLERDEKRDKQWEEKKALKEKEIQAIEHLASAIAGSYGNK